MLDFRRTAFVGSFPHHRQLPLDQGSEVALMGRSNAGKSSIINHLTNQKKLAKTSRTPGRTQAFVAFGIDDHAQMRLMDLPGYGYAKVSKTMRQQWQQQFQTYLQRRHCLRGLIQIMDCRHAFQDSDMLECHRCLMTGHRVHIVLNKADQLNQSQRAKALNRAREIAASLSKHLSCQLYSCQATIGHQTLQETLSHWLLEDQSC